MRAVGAAHCLNDSKIMWHRSEFRSEFGAKFSIDFLVNFKRSEFGEKEQNFSEFKFTSVPHHPPA